MNSNIKPGGKITRLELMPAAWEDMMFVAEMHGKRLKGAGLDKKFKRNYFDGKGDINNWRSFRKYLLDSVASSAETTPFNKDLYGFTANPFTMFSVDGKAEQFVDWFLRTSFPSLLHGWMSNSRRIFTLSSDLQALIGATSLDEVRIRDLKFPFDSFVVELPEPIEGTTGNRYDMLLFSKTLYAGSGENEARCLLIPERVATYSPLSLTLKRELSMLADRKKWDQLHRKVKAAEKHVLGYNDMHTMLVWTANDRDALVTQHVKDWAAEKNWEGTPSTFEDVNALQHALRILAGLCLYVRTLPSVSKYRTDWQRADIEPLAMPVRAITDEAEVCMLSTEFTLTPEERIIFGSRQVSEELAGSTKKNPHFRRGFWKRPNGQGQNPDAEKTIWVRPTVVNRHLLQEGQLPLGAETILLSSKS